MAGVGRNEAQRVGADAGHVERAGYAAMGGGGGVGGERRGLQADGAHGFTQCGASGDEHGDHVGHGGAGEEHPGRLPRHADHLGRPVDHQPLHLDGGMVAAAAIHVENAGEKFREQAGGTAAAVHPAHHARVLVGAGKGQDKAAEILVDRWHFLPGVRQRFAQLGAQ